MDQVKVILKQLQKYHFWLLTAVCMLVGIVGWVLGARTLSADYSANKAKITSKFESLKTLRTTEKPPNSKWKDGISKLTDVERKKVRKAWDQVYDEQKALLLWPDQLGPDFLKFVESNPPDAVIPTEQRELYVNVIPTEFPKLLDIVDAALRVSTTTGPGGAARPPVKQAETNREYTVSWSGESQESVQKLLQWPNIPASEEVRRAQEDLWIYKALLTIIANRNKGHHVPPIKQISILDIGRPAAKAFEEGMASNHIEHLQPAEAAAAGSGGGGGAAAKAEDGAPSPDEGRYVDADGKALTAAPEGQFKRMPVHMRLLMDQREITKFLVECANSPLPVEVRQLRINPSGGKSGSNTGTDRPVARSGATEVETFDVPVELHGIIYIFKKPDATTLGGEPTPGEPAAPATAAAGVTGN